MEQLWRDVRYALRSLRQSPGFTFVAVLTLALGIGANVAIFSAVNGVLLRPLPYPEPDRLAIIWAQWLAKDNPRVSHTGGDFREYQREATLFEDVGALGSLRQTVTGGSEPLQIQVGWVSENFFSVLSVEPLLGRDFTEGEEADSLILSYGFWQRSFAGDESVLGKSVNLDGQPFTVVGVLPADFKLRMSADVGISLDIDAWKPPDPAGHPRRWVVQELNLSTLRVIGRLKEGVTREQAQQQADAIAERLRERLPDHAEVGFHLDVQMLHDAVVGHVRPTLLALMGAVGLVLLIACGNVANLLLARAQHRRKEIALRAALGAPARRIAHQLLTESLVLAGLGGVAGLLLGYGGVRFLVALEPADFPRLQSIRIDATVLAFALGAALLSAVLFGLAPLVRSLRSDLNDVLNERGSRGSAGARLSRLLIVVEVALSLALLAGAGLLMQSFVKLQQVRPGFDTENLLTFSLSLPSTRYRQPVETTAFLKRLEERIGRLPGVVSVGTVWPLPLEGQIWYGPYSTTKVEAENTRPFADYRLSSPSYPATIGARLLEGRLLTEADQNQALVDEKLARLNWPEGSALGQKITLTLGGQPWELEVVGVLENVRHADLRSDGRETAYWPARAYTWADGELAMVVRTANDPMSLADTIRREIHAIDPELPVAKVRPMSGYVDDALAKNRFALVLIVVFAAVALVLSAVGLYGVISYALSRQTREIGIRMACGANRSTILASVMKQGLVLGISGVVLGTLGSLVLTRFVSSLLYGVTARDPLTYAATALVLMVVALLACYVPARRATRVDPMVTLRCE